MTPRPVLTIEDLSVDILRMGQQIPVLIGVNMTIHQGEVHALVGPSGSGKSTLAMLISGILPRQLYAIRSGHLWWHGEDEPTDLLTLNWEQRSAHTGRTMSLIFQEPSTALNPVLHLGEQLMEPERQGITQSDIRQAVERVGLDADMVWDRYPWQLSGGQQQRSLLARTLASHPELILADEPTSALDQHNQNTFLNDLRSVITARHAPGLILISHDLQMVSQIADTVSVIQEGRIIDQGETQKILQKAGYLDAPESSPDLQKKFDSQKKVAATELMIETTDLTAGYQNGQQVVDAIDFTLYQGDVFGIAGPSGSGKSSVLRAILGLMPWQTGQHKVGRSMIRGWQDVQLVYQDPGRSLNPTLTIRQTLTEWARVNPSAVKLDLEAVLQEVGLEASMLDRLPHMFSGGQRQRLAIARALLTDPKVILADEPFSNLDTPLKDQILTLLRTLVRTRKMGVVIVAHDLPRLMRFCDRILVLKEGKVYWEGRPAELTNSGDPWLETLMDSPQINSL